jgi:hypothetical protein
MVTPYLIDLCVKVHVLDYTKSTFIDFLATGTVGKE